MNAITTMRRPVKWRNWLACAEARGTVELCAGARAEVLEAPAVVGAYQVVPLKRGLVGVQCQLDGEVAVGVERHLPARRGGLVEDGVELRAGVVHVLR